MPRKTTNRDQTADDRNPKDGLPFAKTLSGDPRLQHRGVVAASMKAEPLEPKLTGMPFGFVVNASTIHHPHPTVRSISGVYPVTVPESTLLI